MKKPYAFIGNYYHRYTTILSYKNNTYVPDNIGISIYSNFVNNHKSQRNQIPENINNMDFLPANGKYIIESISHSLAMRHNAINRELQNMAIGIFFLIFIRKYWHK